METQTIVAETAYQRLRYKMINSEFNLWAPNFHKIITGLMARYFHVNYDDLLALMAERISSVNAKRVLEVGCGTGLEMSAVARALDEDAKVCGVDLLPAMIAKCNENAVKFGLQHKLEFKNAPAEKLPYPDGSFDVVFSSLCFHHFKTHVALKEQLRVLRPGGRLIVLDLGALEIWRTFKGWLFYNFVTRIRYITTGNHRDEFFAVFRTRDEWHKLLGKYPLTLLSLEDLSMRTGKPSREKLLGIPYTSLGTPPLWMIETLKN